MFAYSAIDVRETSPMYGDYVQDDLFSEWDRTVMEFKMSHPMNYVSIYECSYGWGFESNLF